MAQPGISFGLLLVLGDIVAVNGKPGRAFERRELSYAGRTPSGHGESPDVISLDRRTTSFAISPLGGAEFNDRNIHLEGFHSARPIPRQGLR